MRLDRRAVVTRLREQRLTAVVVVPARDEEATVAGLVRPLAHHLVGDGLLSEVVVVDDGSTDRTAARAEAAGARVVRASDVLPGSGGTGKEAPCGGAWRPPPPTWSSTSTPTWSSPGRTPSPGCWRPWSTTPRLRW